MYAGLKLLVREALQPHAKGDARGRVRGGLKGLKEADTSTKSLTPPSDTSRKSLTPRPDTPHARGDARGRVRGWCQPLCRANLTPPSSHVLATPRAKFQVLRLVDIYRVVWVQQAIREPVRYAYGASLMTAPLSSSLRPHTLVA